MTTSDRDLKMSELLLLVLETLIPGDLGSNLPSAAELFKLNSKIGEEVEFTFEQFAQDYREFCENHDRVNFMRSDLILKFAAQGGSSVSPFLRKLLELYYRDKMVLTVYPEFAGVVFPSHRKMPQNNLEILEPVINLSEKS